MAANERQIHRPARWFRIPSTSELCYDPKKTFKCIQNLYAVEFLARLPGDRNSELRGQLVSGVGLQHLGGRGQDPIPLALHGVGTSHNSRPLETGCPPRHKKPALHDLRVAVPEVAKQQVVRLAAQECLMQDARSTTRPAKFRSTFQKVVEVL